VAVDVRILDFRFWIFYYLEEERVEAAESILDQMKGDIK
jgi:hypothetical protein